MALVMKYQKQYKFSRHRTDKNDVTPTDNAKKKTTVAIVGDTIIGNVLIRSFVVKSLKEYSSAI